MMIVALLMAACTAGAETVVFQDGFASLPSGVVMGVVGAEAEYHYLPETAPKGGWAVSAYRSDPASQRAWKIEKEGGRGVAAMVNKNKARDMHPLLVAGDPAWADYVLRVRFAPEQSAGQTGVVFRYRNDRCYYFFGLHGEKAILKRVRQGKAFRELDEELLAEQPFTADPGQYLEAQVEVLGENIRAVLDDKVVLEARDTTFPEGRIGLLADIPTRFAEVTVSMTPEAKERFDERVRQREAELTELQAKNPKPVVWRKVNTEGFGVGRNLRFGDLDGDGQYDILVGQVLHHGPKDSNSEVSCLTALTFDGGKLWQLGEPDLWKNHLTNDVAFQIHDLDGDGRNEVVYCMNQQIIVADGATGETKYQTPTPVMPENTKAPYNKFPRILGDSMFFCDVRGTGRDADMVLKDRYQSFWVFDDRLQLLWQAQCNTGHYPYAKDIDGDGKDEIAIGYSLFDHDGKRLWSLDGQLQDHADGVAIVQLDPAVSEPRIFLAGSDEGMLLLDLHGNILKHAFLGHVQNPGIADFRPDLPGLETVTVNFWGNQGIVHFFDARGGAYHDFEPFQHGSMCLPVNWTGQPGEYVVLSANAEDGGMFDGWGRCAVRFPADGHPDMCYAVLDVTGDCRDEVVVWDPYELWVYTQNDSPLPRRLYRPVRNARHNDSNYQATVSLPGWTDVANVSGVTDK